ncbi:MAG: hypothetical protein NTX51_17950, partial [Verrucomicrobia bacterium]|nr:hypothetical protein [Verrucomicrobiota bacterium]
MLRNTLIALLTLALGTGARSAESSTAVAEAPASAGTSPPLRQWRPLKDGKDLRLQDFCFFEYQGKTLIASMMKDFCFQGIT